MAEKESPFDAFYRRAGNFLERANRSMDENERKAKVAGNREGEESPLFGSMEKKELQDLARRQHRILEGFFSHPRIIAVVAALYPSLDSKKGRVTIIQQGRLTDVEWPEGLSLRVGQAVRINHQTLQILEIVPDLGIGSIAKVRLIKDQHCEVDLSGSSRLVLMGLAEKEKLHEGDRVVLDSSNSMILLWLGASDRQYKLGKVPSITWEDIAGLEDAKRELREAIVLPLIAADYFAHYRKKSMNGALLYGPPGCGKTMLFEASAREIANHHGGEALESGYILLRGPDIMSEFVSIADQRLRTAFELARQHKRKHGWRAILAIDESEALFKKRGTGVSSDATDSIVQTFLGETSGLQEDNPFVILATNRPDLLDPAVVRNKRIDRHIKIGRPTRQSALELFFHLLKGLPLVGGNAEEFSDYAVSEFFSEKYAFLDVSLQSGAHTQFTLAHVVSGAMLEGVIDKATSVAIERDLQTKQKSGLTKEDIRVGIERTFAQVKDLDHTEPLKEFAQDLKEAVTGIKPLRQVQLP